MTTDELIRAGEEITESVFARTAELLGPDVDDETFARRAFMVATDDERPVMLAYWTLIGALDALGLAA